jgi:hypothetical protein
LLYEECLMILILYLPRAYMQLFRSGNYASIT